MSLPSCLVYFGSREKINYRGYFFITMFVALPAIIENTEESCRTDGTYINTEQKVTLDQNVSEY